MVEPITTADEDFSEQPGPEAMLELIIAKEDEIRMRVKQAENEAQRGVEEAKMDAAVTKRDAESAEVGQDKREKELEEARKEAEKVIAGILAEGEQMKKTGAKRIEDAVKIVVEGVLPPLK